MSSEDAIDNAASHAALEHTVAALQAALDEASAAEARDREFLADASRQLRAPVSSIHAGVLALLRGPPADERDYLLADLVRQGARAARLVDSLLRLARLDAGEPLEPAPCDLTQVCREELDRVRRRAPHLELALDADQLPGTRWQLDEQAVREILAQLLDNARRHAASRIALTVAASGDAVHLRIGDDGPGIPDGVVGRAFGRFTSFDALGGAGLGLAIASDLARLHGGDLAYENRLFVLRLPAQPISGTEPA